MGQMLAKLKSISIKNFMSGRAMNICRVSFNKCRLDDTKYVVWNTDSYPGIKTRIINKKIIKFLKENFKSIVIENNEKNNIDGVGDFKFYFNDFSDESFFLLFANPHIEIKY